MTATRNREPWIGFVHVQPLGNAIPFGEGRKGAFAHIFALAGSASDYRHQVRKTLKNNELLVVEFSDVNRVSDYRAEGRMSVELEELVAALSASSPVQCDVFDTYRHHDA